MSYLLRPPLTPSTGIYGKCKRICFEAKKVVKIKNLYSLFTLFSVSVKIMAYDRALDRAIDNSLEKLNTFLKFAIHSTFGLLFFV